MHWVPWLKSGMLSNATQGTRYSAGCIIRDFWLSLLPLLLLLLLLCIESLRLIAELYETYVAAGV